MSLGAVHRRRLRDIWRSAGWPSQDLVEVELLAAGWVQRVRDAAGRESLRVTDEGVQVLAATLNSNRAARSAHEALVQRVAVEMQRAGRIAWRGLSLRTRVEMPHASSAEIEGRWVMAMPDVFSIRHTTVPEYVEPVVHEVKVRRADLLAENRNPAKRQAYVNLSSQCWYVLAEGIGTQDDVPDAACGVMLACASGLEVLRPAPRRAATIAFGTWMALARAMPELDEDATHAQGLLGAQSATPPPTEPNEASP